MHFRVAFGLPISFSRTRSSRERRTAVRHPNQMTYPDQALLREREIAFGSAKPPPIRFPDRCIESRLAILLAYLCFRRCCLSMHFIVQFQPRPGREMDL